MKIEIDGYETSHKSGIVISHGYECLVNGKHSYSVLGVSNALEAKETVKRYLGNDAKEIACIKPLTTLIKR